MSHPEETFFVNGESLVVRTTTLTVREILDDAGLSPAEHALFEQRNGVEVPLSGLDTPVSLRHGMHFTAHRTSWNIWVNGDKITVNHDVLTFDEVVSYAKDQPQPGPGIEYAVGLGFGDQRNRQLS